MPQVPEHRGFPDKLPWSELRFLEDQTGQNRNRQDRDDNPKNRLSSALGELRLMRQSVLQCPEQRDN